MLSDITRASDPYAVRSRDSLDREGSDSGRFQRRYPDNDRRTPLAGTTRAFDNQGRRPQDPMERSGPYGELARLPPRPSGSGLDPYAGGLGGYERPSKKLKTSIFRTAC